ncbi:MAG: hypothetical protein WCK48_03655 [bacterium]
MKTSDNFSPYAVSRAIWGSILFFFWFIISLVFFDPDWSSVWPFICFHFVLLINTFFSIRSFASLTPKENVGQHIIDAILALCLIAMPLLFNLPLQFMIVCLFLFIVAVLKYLFLVPLVGFSKLLYWKIKVDMLGVVLCFLVLVGVIYGFSYISSIIFFIIFACANVYVLWWNPLYDLELHTHEVPKKNK